MACASREHQGTKLAELGNNFASFVSETHPSVLRVRACTHTYSVCPTSVYCTAIIRRGQERIFPVQHENHLEEGKEGMNHTT